MNFSYYFEVITSVQNKALETKVNVQMLNTSLTDKDSSRVSNEWQDIQIDSTIVPEAYVSFDFNLDINSSIKKIILNTYRLSRSMTQKPVPKELALSKQF